MYLMHFIPFFRWLVLKDTAATTPAAKSNLYSPTFHRLAEDTRKRHLIVQLNEGPEEYDVMFPRTQVF